jgi:hypothetical protein
MKVHRLKCRLEYFQQIADGRKTSEFRRNDRGFAIGDIIHLMEYDHIGKAFTGRWIRRRVTLVTDLEPVGAPGFALLEMRPGGGSDEPGSPEPDQLAESLKTFRVRMDLALAAFSKVVQEMQEMR